MEGVECAGPTSDLLGSEVQLQEHGSGVSSTASAAGMGAGAGARHLPSAVLSSPKYPDRSSEGLGGTQAGAGSRAGSLKEVEP